MSDYIPWGTIPVSEELLRDAAAGYPSRGTKRSTEVCTSCGHNRDVHMRYELARNACYDCHCRDFM